MNADRDQARPPFLSIVVPAYRRAGQLPRLFDSLLSERAADIEVIVVDDASPDDTAAVATARAAQDARVRVMRHVVNEGVHAARNTGLSAARGEWVAFLDADDYLVPDGLARVLATLKAQRDGADIFDVVFFGYRTEGGEPTGFREAGPQPVEALFTGGAYRTEKNCLMAVRAALMRGHGLTWYYTNLDSLFWREAVLRARRQRALFVEPAVGVYDTTTSGSLKKLRADAGHTARHGAAKVEALFRFVRRVDAYLMSSPAASEALAGFLLLTNLKYARPRWRYIRQALLVAARLPLSRGLRVKLVVAAALPAAPALWRLLERRPQTL